MKNVVREHYIKVIVGTYQDAGTFSIFGTEPSGATARLPRATARCPLPRLVLVPKIGQRVSQTMYSNRTS